MLNWLNFGGYSKIVDIHMGEKEPIEVRMELLLKHEHSYNILYTVYVREVLRKMERIVIYEYITFLIYI